MVKNRVDQSVKVSVMGIGNGFSREFVESLSEAGNGIGSVVLDKGDVAGPVLSMLENAL